MDIVTKLVYDYQSAVNTLNCTKNDEDVIVIASNIKGECKEIKSEQEAKEFYVIS